MRDTEIKCLSPSLTKRKAGVRANLFARTRQTKSPYTNWKKLLADLVPEVVQGNRNNDQRLD